MEKTHIEFYFPIQQINKIAEKEGQAKRFYRPVLTMHKWWARRLGSVFRSILLYTLIDNQTKIYDPFNKEWNKIEDKIKMKTIWEIFYLEDIDFGGKIILDPFFGGGTTIIEGLRMGCKIIGKELNPVAWFIVKNEVTPVSLKKLDIEFETLKKKVADDILSYYKTICPLCGSKVDVLYYFWVKILKCLNCEQIVPLYKDYRIAKMRSINVEHKNLVRCEKCSNHYNPMKHKICPSCGQKFNNKKYIHIFCSQCGEIFGTDNYRNDNLCPYCGNIFNPEEGISSGKYYECSNGHKRKIIEAIDRYGKPKEKLFAIEYFCKKCNLKGYKKAEKYDLELFEKVKREFNEKESDLPIPKQKIPNGDCTKSLLNHGFIYFKDMFNERQLLNLGKLLKVILEIKDKNLQEQFLLLFSDSLRYNTENMYNHNKNHILNYFKGHMYHSAVIPVRNNVWGTEFGTGSFSSQYRVNRDGLKYLLEPFEKYRKNDKTHEKKMYNKIKAKFANKFDDLKNGANCLLLQGSSEYLEIPDDTIDAVITDPPYYDNVMYSELSDFFYVWLRKGLKDQYHFFKSEQTPKRAEIIKNPYQNKGDKEYTEGLTNVFRECYKKLKDNGVFIFTFHHKGIDAWVAILKTILSSNFYVSAVYPIQAEMKTSTHIINKANIEYDMIIVCRKRLKKPNRVIWQKLQDEIFLNVGTTINELEIDNNMNDGDKFVIAMGKCLEIYSKNWPEIYSEDKLIKIEEAIEDIKIIVDNHFNKIRFSTLEKETDRITALYLQFLANNKSIEYNELNKAFQQRNLNINEIFEKKLAIKEKNKVKILTYNNRKEYLENLSQDKMTAIDQVHYILNLKDAGKFTKIDLNWIKDEALIVFKRLNIKDSDRLIKYIKKARTQKRIEL